MFTRPDDLGDGAIFTRLRAGWGFEAVTADYLAAGFGSHHWVARNDDGHRRFVTVDDLEVREFLGPDPTSAFDALSSAFAVARALWLDGASWVVAPLPARDGRILRRLSARYSIAVFPYVEGAASAAYSSNQERAAVLGLLAELHRSPVEAPARRETFVLPHRQDLEVALDSVDCHWTGGPYSERARTLVRYRGGEVRRMLDEYDGMVLEVLRHPVGWTVTHGEPQSGNVLRTREGLLLIDVGRATRT